MNIEQHLDDFINKNIDLKDTRIKRLSDSERIMREFIEKDDVFSKVLKELIPQGSYRQSTLIKPVDENIGFDVDLLVVLEKIEGWEAQDYLKHLTKMFEEDGRYKDITKTHGKTRCVTIDYEGEFHIDLVPAILDNGIYKICNKNTNEFEPSDGDGYADWFATKNAETNSYLIDVIRILKYLRDSKKEFDTKSIIITTMFAMQVNNEGSTNKYENLYSTLNNLLINLDNYLQQFDIPPTIQNPAMPKENFNRHWKNEPEKFKNLKNTISKYRVSIETAFNSLDESEIKKNLLNVFGDNFFTPKESETILTGSPVKTSFTPHSPHA